MPDLIKTDSSHPHFQSLVVLLDQDLAIRDGDEHDFYNQFNKISSIRHVVLAYEGETPVACGAFKPYDETAAEIKRMYVLPGYRGRGFAAQVLLALENWALESGYASCILETGKKQPEAIALYQKSGYHIIPNYGQYENVENSVCMKKLLVDQLIS